MSIEELEKTIHPNGDLESYLPFIRWYGKHADVQLDGWYSVEELRWIANYIEARLK